MKYILITGGGLFNKGAQAMTFTVITEMKKRFPDKEIVLLSRMDYERDENEKNKYNFTILPWNMAIKSYLLGNKNAFIASLRNKKKYKEYESLFEEIKSIFEEAEAIIDISGFSLSSQITKKSILSYISNVMVAKKFSIPIWLFPQSFGPFDFTGIYKYINKGIIKKYLKYVTNIFVREESGYNELMNYTDWKLKNVTIMPDIVLQSKSDYVITSIYKDADMEQEYDDIKKNSIAIVPNMRVVDRIGERKLLDLYGHILSCILDTGKNIYILRHSTEDLDICRKIKNLYPNEERVKVIAKDYSCIELEGLIKNFDYIIGSRYHSIVHAYKNGVPAISFGWAVKYQELLAKFKQERFIFDIRDEIDLNSVLNALNDMDQSHEKESSVILNVLKDIQKNDVFAIMEKSL